MQDTLQPRTGRDLAALRDSYGITQERLAAELKKHRITIIRWERPTSEVKPIRWATVDRACRAIYARAAGGDEVAS